jgi:chromosome segregation ATPase
MSEERLDRIEAQIANLSRSLEDRISILEGTLLATMRGGFNNLHGTVNDVDANLAKVEQRAEDTARKVRRLNQRLMNLEGRTEESDAELT